MKEEGLDPQMLFLSAMSVNTFGKMPSGAVLFPKLWVKREVFWEIMFG